MIKYLRGNLLEAKAEALVNTVNTVGVMGKGIALQFKKAFPDNYKAYSIACERGEVQIGKMYVFPMPRLNWPRYIINFPTKKHWKSKSRLEDIEAGLVDLVKIVNKAEIESIAIPPLGCGLGGLPWNKVKNLVEEAFIDLSHVKVLFYEPAGAPRPETMPIRTNKPNMTLSRAVITKLIDLYSTPLFYEFVSLLEVQKLAYFQQVSGENLRLGFEKGRFGPYADNLRHVLNHMDGHYITGWGDGQNKPRTPLHLLPGAIQEADKFLEKQEETKKRFNRVSRLIEGYETPYGMELLGTVHWIMANELQDKTNLGRIVKAVKTWTRRKEHLFTPAHIEKAHRRLLDYGWV